MGEQVGLLVVFRHAVEGEHVVSDRLVCYSHGAKFNQSAFCAPEHWVRWNGGLGASAGYIRSYKSGTNFFGVVWQVNAPKGESATEFSSRVRLQVEAPTYGEDPELNDLKSEFVNRLLQSGMRNSLSKSGFGYEPGVRVSDDHVRSNKATTVFTILLDGNQIGSSPDETIQIVHDAVGTIVDSIVNLLSTRLAERFGS